MLCCGRFTANEQLLYYEDGEGERMPFHVKSPPLPPSYDPESGERFSLNWLRSTHPVKLILRQLARSLRSLLKRG